MSLAVGRRLGDYEIVAPLGVGGMGEVYRARDTRLGRDVAVKVLSEAVASRPELLARFEQEAKTVAALNHPNIVTLFSIDDEDGIRFLTMELVEGETLDLLVRPGGLPLADVFDLAIPLADALVAAHDRGVVHRDLKPGNVMVTRERRVKVLDFGLAKLTSGGEKGLSKTLAGTVAAPLTMAGQMVGTVPYMAPEQLRGESVDARTDVFALGIILFELATGRRPFTGASPVDVSSSILRDPPPAATALRGDLPRHLERIIGKCLEKDPRDRFQTARDLHDELKSARPRLADVSAAPGPPIQAMPAPLGEDVPSIAVLPFVNVSGDEENEYFADGLSEELVNVLAKIHGLRVAARSSSFHFKGKDATIATMGRTLNVATILEGGVRKSGQRVRITVQLVQVTDGYHIWSERYDRTLEDIFAVQDDIAQSVVKELRTRLVGREPDSSAVRAELAGATKGRGESGEAHRLYLQGRYFAGRSVPEEVTKGIGYFRRALETDPSCALAWAGLARAYTLEAELGWVPVLEGYDRARDAAERSLRLEPDLVEGHVALGRVRMESDWDWPGAEASLRRAVELAPGNAEVARVAGVLAANLGRFEIAGALLRRAVTLNPVSAGTHRNLGFHCLCVGQLGEAVESLRKSLELNPQAGATHFFLALVHLTLGRVKEALAESRQEAQELFRLLGYVLVHHAAGERAEADAAMGDLLSAGTGGGAYQIAQAYAFRGDSDRSFDWLDRAYSQRDPGLAEIKRDPLLRHLHGDDRWRALVEKVGLAD